MAYVDLNEFTKCMNAYESIVSNLAKKNAAKKEADA